MVGLEHDIIILINTIFSFDSGTFQHGAPFRNFFFSNSRHAYFENDVRAWRE